MSFGCVAVQIITLGTLLLTSDWVKRDGDFAVTTRGIDTVSAKENIVVFILDTFDEEFFREIQAENPEFLEPLDGFTHFNNATGMYPTTKGALPFILTGLANNNEMPYVDYTKEAFQNATQYDDLISANYDVGIYTESVFFNSEICKEFVCNLEQTKEEVSSYTSSLSTLYKITAFRYAPHIIKNQY